MLSVTAEDLSAGLQLFEREERLGAFDAVLVAAAARRADAVVSADVAFAFAVAPGIVHIVRDDLGVDRLLAQ